VRERGSEILGRELVAGLGGELHHRRQPHLRRELGQPLTERRMGAGSG
jgi:hypothetical protein